MNRKASWNHLVLVGLCAAATTPLVLAQPAPPQFDAREAQSPAAAWPTRVGRLSEYQGVVWFYDRDEGAWTQAVPNRPLTSGDRISTERGARATLRIGSTTLRLDGETDLGLRRLDDQAIHLDLDAGSLSVRIAARDVVSELEVATPEGRFQPRSIGHFRFDRQGNDSQASVWRGQLVFDAPDSQLEINAGQHAQLWMQGNPPATHYRLLPLERDDFANWVTRADVEAGRSETARWVSPEMTGAEDLDRYGRWTQSPDYGSVWIPQAVPSGWAPYQDGRWVWVSPWGWTWMDAAPWGFAPFHYGRWVLWGGRWAWAPGVREHRPAYAPAVVHWTPAPQREWRNHRPPPPSAWVPLKPREPYRPPVHGLVPPPPQERAVPLPPHRGQEPGRRPGDRPGDRAGDRPADRPGDRPGERPRERAPDERPDPATMPPPALLPPPLRPRVGAPPPAVAPAVVTPAAPSVQPTNPRDQRTPRASNLRPMPEAAPAPAPAPVAAPAPAPMSPRQLTPSATPIGPQHGSQAVPAPANSPPAATQPGNAPRLDGPRNDRGHREARPPAPAPAPAPTPAPVAAPAPVPAPAAAPEGDRRRRTPEQNERQRERSNVL